MANKRPLISILMNCYNSASFLEEALDSVLAQTYLNWEIIFWDNRSTDRSADIFKGYKDPRFKYFLADAHTNLGEARNCALQKTKGDWIAFLDCDDIWEPEKLEKQVAIIIEDLNQEVPLGIVYGRCGILNAEGKQGEWGRHYIGKKLPERNILKELLMVENFITIPSAVVSREAYLQFAAATKGFRQAEDYCLFAGISTRYRARALQDICCWYRVHENNLSKKQRTLEIDENIETIEKWSSFLPAGVTPGQLENRLRTLHSIAGITMILFDGNLKEGLKRIMYHGSIKTCLRAIVEKISYTCPMFRGNL